MTKLFGSAILLLLVLSVAGGAILSDAAAASKLPKEQPANTVAVHSVFFAPNAANASAADAIFKVLTATTKKQPATYAYVFSKSLDSKTGGYYYIFEEEYSRFSGWLAHLTDPKLNGVLPKVLKLATWVSYDVTTFNTSEVPLLDAVLKPFGLPYRLFLGQPGSFRR